MLGRPLISGLLALAGGTLLGGCAPADDAGPVVLAASSMQEGLSAAADDWEARGHARPVLSFASSSAVARQVDEGAPADLVVTSDKRWIGWLAQRDALASEALPLVANQLVVVAPTGQGAPASLATLAAEPGAGRLAIGDPDSVPAGEFARAALLSMGLWDKLAERLAPGENVRASLALVERGEAALGIVYASDAAASEQVRVVEEIAPETHPRIIYYVAVAGGSEHPRAQDFLDYLTSAEGRQKLVEQGLSLP